MKKLVIMNKTKNNCLRDKDEQLTKEKNKEANTYDDN